MAQNGSGAPFLVGATAYTFPQKQRVQPVTHGQTEQQQGDALKGKHVILSTVARQAEAHLLQAHPYRKQNIVVRDDLSLLKLAICHALRHKHYVFFCHES